LEDEAIMALFLKLEGIEGEIKGEIQIESFSWGVQNSHPNAGSAGSGAGSGKASFQDFMFTSRLGKQSPQLFQAAIMGNSLGQARLAIIEPPSHILVTFSNVFISSYKEDLALGGAQDRPTESVSFVFEGVEVQVSGAHIKG
jgi:type VI secretion system secreted protein Hcp